MVTTKFDEDKNVFSYEILLNNEIRITELKSI